MIPDNQQQQQDDILTTPWKMTPSPFLQCFYHLHFTAFEATARRNVDSFSYFRIMTVTYVANASGHKNIAKRANKSSDYMEAGVVQVIIPKRLC